MPESDREKHAPVGLSLHHRRGYSLGAQTLLLSQKTPSQRAKDSNACLRQGDVSIQ